MTGAGQGVTLAPGATADFTIQVTALSGTGSFQAQKVKLTATGPGSPARTDTATLQATVMPRMFLPVGAPVAPLAIR